MDDDNLLEPEKETRDTTTASDDAASGTDETVSALSDFLFFNARNHSIDGKGRIIIPAEFRKGLGDSFAIGPTRDFRAIALYPTPVFEEMLREIARMNKRKPSVQRYVTQFFKLSSPAVQSDAQGRLLLPPVLRERMLGDTRDVEIGGIGDHVRVSVKEDANDEFIYLRDHIDEINEEIAEME